METETYLNLGSEQFNSWVNEFENKYNKIEKTNVSTINSISSNEKIDLSDKELQKSEYSDIEESSVSEDDQESSNVFISQSKKLEVESDSVENQINNESTETSAKSSEFSRRLIYNRRFYRRSDNSNSNRSTIENVNDLRKEVIKKNNYTSESDNFKNNSNVQKIVRTSVKDDKIMTLKELNNILPLENKVKVEVKEKLDDNQDNKQQSNTVRLGERALYRYIALRRR